MNEVEQLVCRICSDKAKGMHYGVITCEGCKGFFKRVTSMSNPPNYRCYFGWNCPLTPETRNNCKACRLQRCIELRMMDNVGKKKSLAPFIEAFSGKPSSDPISSTSNTTTSLATSTITSLSTSPVSALDCTPSGRSLIRKLKTKSLGKDSAESERAEKVDDRKENATTNVRTVDNGKSTNGKHRVTITNKKAYLLKAAKEFEIDAQEGQPSPPSLQITPNGIGHVNITPANHLSGIDLTLSFDRSRANERTGIDTSNWTITQPRDHDGKQSIDVKGSCQAIRKASGRRDELHTQYHEKLVKLSNCLERNCHGQRALVLSHRKVICSDLWSWLASEEDGYRVSEDGALDMRMRSRSPVPRERTTWKHDLVSLYGSVYEIAERHRKLARAGGWAWRAMSPDTIWTSLMQITRQHTAISSSFCQFLPGIRALPESDIGAIASSSLIGLWLLGYASRQYYNGGLLIMFDEASPPHHVNAGNSILGSQSQSVLATLDRLDGLKLSTVELALIMAVYVTSGVHSAVRCTDKLAQLHRCYCTLLRLACRQRPASQRHALLAIVNDLEELVISLYRRVLRQASATHVLSCVSGLPEHLLSNFAELQVSLPDNWLL